MSCLKCFCMNDQTQFILMDKNMNVFIEFIAVKKTQLTSEMWSG